MYVFVLSQRQYLKANDYFGDAYNAVMKMDKEYLQKKSLIKLSRVMYGIGRAHLSFSNLIETLRGPKNLSVPKIISWRNKGGPFTGEVTEHEDNLINLDEAENENKEAEISEVVEKLIQHELNQQ